MRDKVGIFVVIGIHFNKHTSLENQTAALYIEMHDERTTKNFNHRI